jgi:hypothetical protein
MDSFILKGLRVEMICFAAFSAYLHFERDVILTLEGEFIHSAKGAIAAPPVGASSSRWATLLTLIETTVIEVKPDKNSSLYLAFSNGESIYVKPRKPPYDSFSLSLKHDLNK